MSIHPSLRVSKASGALKNVPKRAERVRALFEQTRWEEGDSVFGLPKVKQTKIKAKKA